MAEQLIISVSGLRGIVGENLTPRIATEYGCALGAFLKSGQPSRSENSSVCIGRDSRTSGQMIKSAVTAGLCATGIDVIDLGLATTPSVSVMVTELRCAGGLIITASHNPIQYNGIKFLLSNGMAPGPDLAEQIRQHFLKKDFACVHSRDCGKVNSNDQAPATHIVKVLAIVDKATIGARRFKVVLDSVNGAGGPVTKKLLAQLGCKVLAINDEPTGLFAHTPEPTDQNVKQLCEAVKIEGAEVGFAQDPDADRLAIVDETGSYIGEEYTLALAAKYIFEKKTGKAATNLSTSSMIDDVAEKAGGQVIRTAVGEANVATAMVQYDCLIGGEGNGGVIDLRVSPVRDSLIGMALILQLMAETGKTISQLVSEIGGYYMTKDKFAADKNQAAQILDLARKTFADARLDTTDGYRFDFEDAWVHLRASNTEPAMRLIVEARNRAVAQEYIDAVGGIRKKVLD